MTVERYFSSSSDYVVVATKDEAKMLCGARLSKEYVGSETARGYTVRFAFLNAGPEGSVFEPRGTSSYRHKETREKTQGFQANKLFFPVMKSEGSVSESSVLKAAYEGGFIKKFIESLVAEITKMGWEVNEEGLENLFGAKEDIKVNLIPMETIEFNMEKNEALNTKLMPKKFIKPKATAGSWGKTGDDDLDDDADLDEEEGNV